MARSTPSSSPAAHRPAPLPNWPPPVPASNWCRSTDPQADGLRKASPFFAVDNIPADTYKGVAGVKTLAVGAQWVTSDKADAETVYEITKALYSEPVQKALAAGHAKGKLITQGATRSRALASPSIRVPRSSTRKPAC